MRKKLLTIIGFLLWALSGSAQQYIGSEGLIHVPTADMDTVGIARVGAHYIPKAMMPDRMLLDGEKFNSWTNYLSVTPFRWIELGYGYTLWKLHKNLNKKNEVGFYSKDRYFSVRLQLLQEGRWWPAVAVGGNDVWGSSDNGVSASNYYRNYYASLSKHVDVKGHEFGAHVTYRKWKQDFNHKWNGVVGGLTYRPAFYRPLRLVGEWDGCGVNVGADCRLFKYFLVQCALLDFSDFNAGLCLYIPLYKPHITKQ